MAESVPNAWTLIICIPTPFVNHS
uniref:Uncharacterized protein n=1 Tax=Anguilla anguilla TaxID=7936 RepID=A0A0E9VGQ4_ANGAN